MTYKELMHNFAHTNAMARSEHFKTLSKNLFITY